MTYELTHLAQSFPAIAEAAPAGTAGAAAAARNSEWADMPSSCRLKLLPASEVVANVNLPADSMVPVATIRSYVPASILVPLSWFRLITAAPDVVMVTLPFTLIASVPFPAVPRSK